MNVREILELITTKNWCDISDLMKLTGLSRISALKIKNKIKKELNYEIHTTKLPMNIVVDYLNIDINYLKKITNEKEAINEDNK